MTKAGIDYIRGIYETAQKRRAENDKNPVGNIYSHGFFCGYHSSSIDLCESIAEFEHFSLKKEADHADS
jgi:hypothetical protein